MAKQTYKRYLSTLLSKHGRVREWVIKESGIARTTFERKVRQNTLSNEEKKNIESIIITGK